MQVTKGRALLAAALYWALWRACIRKSSLGPAVYGAMALPAVLLRHLVGERRLGLREAWFVRVLAFALRVLPRASLHRVFARVSLAQRRLKRLLPPQEPLARIEQAGFKAAWLGAAPPDRAAAVLLFAHGGGYVSGRADMYSLPHSALLRRLRARAGLREVAVLSVDYTLAPAAPFPGALTELLAAYEWLVDEAGVPPSRVVLAGDSAGGALALGLAQYLRGHGSLPTPAGMVLVSPWCELSQAADSYRRNAGRDYLCAQWLSAAAADYLQGRHKADNPLVSPVRADLRQLPPALVLAGEDELFVDDIRDLVRRLGEAGNAVEYVEEPGQVHNYAMYTYIFGAAASRALDQVSDFVAKRVGGEVL